MNWRVLYIAFMDKKYMALLKGIKGKANVFSNIPEGYLMSLFWDAISDAEDFGSVRNRLALYSTLPNISKLFLEEKLHSMETFIKVANQPQYEQMVANEKESGIDFFKSQYVAWFKQQIANLNDYETLKSYHER